jgi:hypothetical protein
MRLQVADSSQLQAEGIRADPARLLEAGRRMALQMRDELWGYFGLSVTVAVNSDSIDITAEPTNMSRAEDVATTEILRGVQQRLAGQPAATVMRTADDQIWRWRRARGRMRGLLDRRSSSWISMQTRPPFGYELAVLMSWCFLPASGGYVVNPFTWWLQARDGWIRGQREASSNRGRAAHSPTMHAYHETVHAEGCLFHPDDTVCSGTTSLREPTTVVDVDWAFRDHASVAPRSDYGGFPGCLSYLRQGRVDFPPSSTRMSGTEWVVWPTLAELASGASMPETWQGAGEMCQPRGSR